MEAAEAQNWAVEPQKNKIKDCPKCKQETLEELIAYFPLINRGLHRKRRVQQYF
jgi:hypothetical protein